MDGTEPFKPFIERYGCYGVTIERVPGTDPATGRTNTYRITVYGNAWEDFWKMVEKCRLFYGNGFRMSYATPMGRVDENPTYFMVEVDEPDVIPGHNMLQYEKIIKNM